MTRAMLLPALVGAVVSAVLGFALGTLASPPTSRAAPDPQAPARVVRAERFEMVDARGAVRALLAVQEDDATVLKLQRTDTAGPGAVVTVHPDDRVDLGLLDRTGRIRAGLGLTVEGLPVWVLVDSAGQPRARLRLLPDGSPDLELLTETGQALWRAP